MEPTTENPADIWKRFRGGEKSVEELAAEQGYRPPAPGEWPFEGLFESEEEASEFRVTVDRWREEDRRSSAP